MLSSAIWPVRVECGSLALRPISRRDKREWLQLRQQNAAWLAPWEASNPEPNGSLPQFAEMVRSLNRQAKLATALPWIITEIQPGRPAPVIVGQLTVSSIVWGSAMMATLGYWVDQASAGRGIARERAVEQHAMLLGGDVAAKRQRDHLIAQIAVVDGGVVVEQDLRAAGRA